MPPRYKLQTKETVEYFNLKPIKDFKRKENKHPEQKEGEILLCNDTDKSYKEIGWKTKRRGKQAYEIIPMLLEGKLIKVKGLLPTFVQKSEMIAYRENKFIKKEN